MPDENNFPPASASAAGGGGGGRAMQRQMATAAAQQQQAEPVRCPRCDSSNTKFCYYNNYSLSQPRHFCKSCKRYWTRGGTLRNVPVGGGCRKNKRGVKRPAPATATGTTALRSSSGNKPLPPFSYVNPHKVDLGYASSLGFSFPSLMGGNGGGYFLRDFVIPSSNSVIPGYGASSEFCPMTSLDGIPSMASSLIASTIFQEQHKFMSTGGLGYKEARGIRNNSKPLYPFENLQVKFDEGHLGDDVVKWSVPCQTQVHEIDSSNLTRSLCWNTIANGAIGSWHPEAGSNVGSSVPSLI